MKLWKLSFSDILQLTRATLKTMPAVSLCWPTTSEADGGGMAVEAEPSFQYPITCCCCVTDGSRGALWHNGVWCGSARETNVYHWILPCGKNGTQWHPSMFAEHFLWRPNRGEEHSEAVVVHFSSGDNNGVSPPLVWIFVSMVCRLLFIAGENA